MAEPTGMIVSLLHEIRGEMKDRFSDIGRKFEALDARFEPLEKQVDDLLEALSDEAWL